MSVSGSCRLSCAKPPFSYLACSQHFSCSKIPSCFAPVVFEIVTFWSCHLSLVSSLSPLLGPISRRGPFLGQLTSETSGCPGSFPVQARILFFFLFFFLAHLPFKRGTYRVGQSKLFSSPYPRYPDDAVLSRSWPLPWS